MNSYDDFSDLYIPLYIPEDSFSRYLNQIYKCSQCQEGYTIFRVCNSCAIESINQANLKKISDTLSDYVIIFKKIPRITIKIIALKDGFVGRIDDEPIINSRLKELAPQPLLDDLLRFIRVTSINIKVRYAHLV